MMPDDILYTVTSRFGHLIRITARQRAHVAEAHDYMSGNIDKVLETLAEPDRIVTGKQGESIGRHENVKKKRKIPLETWM